MRITYCFYNFVWDEIIIESIVYKHPFRFEAFYSRGNMFLITKNMNNRYFICG